MKPALLNQYEKVLDDFAGYTSGVSAALAKASQTARLRSGDESEHFRGLRLVTCSVAAPLLVCYVGWILARARSNGIRRFYFVSRDGYILLRIAQRLAAGQADPPELRYLYGSRAAWHAPAVETLDPAEVNWLFEGASDISIEDIFGRLNCRPQIAGDLLQRWSFPLSEWRRPLTASECESFRERVIGNQELAKCVVAELKASRELLGDYLRQEGLLDDTPWAMVDLGWHGRLQDSLARVLGSLGWGQCLGYYFGLRGELMDTENVKREAFLFDHRGQGAQSLPTSDVVYLMESFCTAPHGSVAGYRRESSRIVPEFRAGHTEQLCQWGLQEVHRAYDDYLSELPLGSLSQADWAATREMVIALLRKLSLRPETLEARAWGAFPYETDQNGGQYEPLAAPRRLTLRGFRHCLDTGSSLRGWAEWVGGADAQTSPITLGLYRAFAQAGRAGITTKRALKRVLRGRTVGSLQT